jgi:hypothetical protein
MKLETLEIGTKLKVVKDIYYICEDSMEECSYLTKEELFATLTHMCVLNDIYEVIEDEGEKCIQCIAGEWEGETNDGWFEVDDMIEKGAFEILTEQ